MSVLDLTGVEIDLRQGEVHALLGENGAGKSTLLKILGGVHRPDAGQIFLDDRPVDIDSPHAAQKLRIALIHQEPLIFPDLDVAENIDLGHGGGDATTVIGLLNRRAIYQRAAQLLTSLGVTLNARTKLRGLSIADQQTVELAGALSQNARMLLMDEPTASLTPGEVAELFRIVRQLKSGGTSIVFISHRLEEIFAIADRITVLRDGQFVGTRSASETNVDEIIQMMVGRPLQALYEKKPAVPDRSAPPRLKVENLSRERRFGDISLDVYRGEIVGLAGLVGAGRTDVAQTIFGITKPASGRVYVDGVPAFIKSPRDAVDLGLCYVPEDRQHDGLLLPFSVATNTALADLGSVSTAGLIARGRERCVADLWRHRLGIRLHDVSQPARELSGGNQQKVVLGKWLQTDPQILILDEPTRGIDIGAKAEVHRLMSELAAQGKAILMISSDLPEVLAMSDRILVMREGRLTAEFSRDEATQEKVMAAATGQASGPGAHGHPQRTREESQVVESRSPVEIPREYAPDDVGRGARLVRALPLRELGIAAFIVLTFIVASIVQPRFVSIDNIRSILLYTPLIVVVAMGQMMVIITRNIDLSVGSMMGLAGIIACGIFRQHPQFPVAVATMLAIAVGAALGLINGLLVAQLRVPAIIATLGTMTTYRGLVFIVSHGQQINSNDLPDTLLNLRQTGPLGISWLVVIACIIAIATALFLRYARAGREIYAIGSNPGAAVLRGIGVRSRLMLVFVATGALSGLAGMMYAAKFWQVNPRDAGRAFELVAISAVVLGGVNVFGGSGTVLGVLLGCLMLGVINVALSVMRIPEGFQVAAYGAAILIAATIDTLLQRRLAPSPFAKGLG